MQSLQQTCNLFLLLVDKPPDELLVLSENMYARLIGLAKDSLCGKSYSRTYMEKNLETVLDISHQKMRSAAMKALAAWRMVYTDACILRVLVVLDASTASRCVEQLDRAIIIAGGGDTTRLDLTLSLIKQIQQFYLQPLTSQKVLTKSKSQQIISKSLSTSLREVPVLESDPSFVSFQQNLSSHPFVIRQYAKDWPALNEHPWNSIDYLLKTSGPSRTVPIEIGGDYRNENWSQTLSGWGQFLDTICEEARPLTETKEYDTLYLAQYDLTRQFPSLRDDIVIPDYTYCSLNPYYFTAYAPPATPEGIILNLWLGPKSATSPAHFDPYYNIYVQVVGYKTVWLAPPGITENMEAVSVMKRSNPGEQVAVEPSYCSSNSSSIDVFSDQREQFPYFFEKAVPEAMHITLGPGDLLFFPPGWWHAMRSESTSFSISMWF